MKNWPQKVATVLLYLHLSMMVYFIHYKVILVGEDNTELNEGILFFFRIATHSMFWLNLTRITNWVWGIKAVREEEG